MFLKVELNDAQHFFVVVKTWMCLRSSEQVGVANVYNFNAFSEFNSSPTDEPHPGNALAVFSKVN